MSDLSPQRTTCATTALLFGLIALPLHAQSGAVTRSLPESNIQQLHDAMLSGLLTAEGLTARYLARAIAYDDQGPRCNSMLTRNPDALLEARSRDRDAARGNLRGPLFGIPILLKDNVDALPMPTTAGSVALANSVPPDDSTLARKLRDAGAVVLGKATLTEFANFMANGMPNGYSSLGGSGANPYDPRRFPNGFPRINTGGSSSGSAIGTAANLATAAIGTETSGSILSPASANGVVGIKPTLGLVSRDGILPITADQDTAGPIARTVADAARVLGVIAGYDPADPATQPCQTPGNCFADYTQFLDRQALRGARIAVPPLFVSGDERTIMLNAIGILRAAGATVVQNFQLPRPNVGDIAVRYPPGPNDSTVLIYGLKRDLNRYLSGLGSGAPRKTLAEIIAYNVANPRTALIFGQSILTAADRYDTSANSADTRRYLADRARDETNCRSVLDAAYAGPDQVPGTADDYDALLFPANWGADTPARAGYPSICVPGGQTSAGLPFGVTFSGPAFRENRLIALAYAFEQTTGHRAAPASAPALPTDQIPMTHPSVAPVGTACLGSAGRPTIGIIGPPILGNGAFRIALGSLPQNAPTVLAIADGTATTMLGSCTVYLRAPLGLVRLGRSDGSGNSEFEVRIPWLPSLSGVTMWTQGAVDDPSANPLGVVTSGALAIRIGG